MIEIAGDETESKRKSRPMKDNQLLDFEIHTGFSRRSVRLFDRLATEGRGVWKVLEVSEVVNGPVSMTLFDAHDVPGNLGLMAIKRVTDQNTALAEVNRVARKYASEPGVRIELEQVLMTVLNGKSSSSPVAAWIPDAEDFEDGILICETPPFEAHFSLEARTTGALIKYSTKTLIDVATSAGIPVHQAVRFSTEDQVILTTFFATYEEMVDSTTDLAASYQSALDHLDGVRLKVVAERIISCVQPRG